MTMNAFVIPFAIAAVVWIFIFFDWRARRRDREKNERRT